MRRFLVTWFGLWLLMMYLFRYIERLNMRNRTFLRILLFSKVHLCWFQVDR